jgi:hypothetical protein
MKSAWHIISVVETESLNLLSKHLKIYGAHAAKIYWSAFLFNLRNAALDISITYINAQIRQNA